MLSDGYLQKITCFRLCIDEKKEESDAVRGRIYGIALKEPVLFSSYSEVLMKLEKILDEIGFPQAFQQLRSFRREEKETMKKKNEVIQYHSAEEIDVEKGSLNIVGVNGRSMSSDDVERILNQRRKKWQPKPLRYTKGAIRLFAEHCTSPMKGAYLDFSRK